MEMPWGAVFSLVALILLLVSYLPNFTLSTELYITGIICLIISLVLQLWKANKKRYGTDTI